tara:strand:+ start:273 stop:638 length:366 start_codon:yes stop_codon:yes gene_type:complete
MPIKLNRNFFMDDIKAKFGREGRNTHGDQAVDLSDDVFSVAQRWFDEEPWKSDPELDTKRELRISLRRYIKSNIDLSDHKKSYFLPTFIWVYIAQQVIGWIVKKIIEHYFGAISRDFPENN